MSRTEMKKVRVFLPTYRRNRLLERSLGSLLAQSCKDWFCEVHNDDPSDPFPSELVAKVADARIRTVNHAKNLGGGASMNAFYGPIKEEFFSILEDDNWWEPEFLGSMLQAAERHPKINVFWANMRIWNEDAHGEFQDTGKTIHPWDGKTMYEEIAWPDPRQIMGGVHSNGACLIRAGGDSDYRIPKVPFATIEMFRERCFPHPLLLLRKPLANFSVTLKSERANDMLTDWGVATALLAATFFRHASWPGNEMQKTLIQGRQKQPPPTNTLLNAGLIEPKCRIFFQTATPKEKLKWILGFVRRPSLPFRLLSSKRLHPDWWSFLNQHTKDRFREARLQSQSKES